MEFNFDIAARISLLFAIFLVAWYTERSNNQMRKKIARFEQAMDTSMMLQAQANISAILEKQTQTEDDIALLKIQTDYIRLYQEKYKAGREVRL